MITEKYCLICDRTLPVSKFDRDPKMPDGYYPKCRECASDKFKTNVTITCSACGKRKPVSEYYVRKNGCRHTVCAECSREKRREYYRRTGV